MTARLKCTQLGVEVRYVFLKNKETLLPYFYMTVAKLTSKNRLALPEDVMEQAGGADYFEVTLSGEKITLTPLRASGAGMARKKLAKLHISNLDIENAIAWARKNGHSLQTPV